jgi:hypothetical protein
MLFISFSRIFISSSNTEFFGTNVYQVTWMSYESSEMMALQESHGLNSKCFLDMTRWMTQCPLIFYYVVEYHLPSQVMQ